VTNLRKPPKTFLDLGDVVGLPEVTMKELGVKDWDFVEIKTGGGATLGVKVKAHGVSPTDIFAAKAIRDIIGLKEGPVELKLNAVKWPSGQDPKPVPQTFTQVVRASKIFLRYGTAVGVSLDMMRAMNATHGQKGTISIPNGRPIDISIFCVDRGSDVIMLKGDLRKALGLPESGSVTLIVTPKAGTVPPPPPPTPSPEGATDAAKDGESD
jgi:antitoxin component of MazEF toxin-antitoxin module